MKLGILVSGSEATSERLDALRGIGFESLSLHFWEDVGHPDWGELADRILSRGWAVSCLSVYGNVLGGPGAVATAHGWETLIREAGRFGTKLVTGFAGRVPGSSIPESIEPWKALFAPLIDEAAASGLRLAFENCRMGGSWKTGTWNMAYSPAAWELMEAALPGVWDLEFDPGHAILAYADPLVQLTGWESRVAHLHGKDGHVDAEHLAREGAFGKNATGQFVLPGKGDSPWGEILTRLQRFGFAGNLDIEAPSERTPSLQDLADSLRFLTELNPKKSR